MIFKQSFGTVTSEDPVIPIHTFIETTRCKLLFELWALCSMQRFICVKGLKPCVHISSFCLLFAVVILVCRGKKSKCWHECFRNMWIKSIVKIYFELNILEFHCHQLDCHIRTEGDWWIHAWWFKLLSSQLKKKKKAHLWISSAAPVD